MVRSMTGYGRAEETYPFGTLSVELKSVNNRYFDCNIRMPRMYQFAEDPIRKYLKQNITRGKVDVYVSFVQSEGKNVKISLNRPVLEGYLSAVKQMEDEYGVPNDISASSVVHFPDIFISEEETQDEEIILNALMSVCGKALAVYDTMRIREGEHLCKDIRLKCEEILVNVEYIELQVPESVKAYREKLYAKMQEILQNTEIDDARILQEAAIYSDKIATDEETVRLRSHVAQLLKFLDEGGAIGRKLDFLMQEMNRESNTIGSKSDDISIKEHVVELKSVLEKIREQIQNLE